MAEIELHVLNSQCLNRRIDSIDKVVSETKAWQEYRNNKNAIISWQFTTKDSRIKLKRLYPSVISCHDTSVKLNGAKKNALQFLVINNNLYIISWTIVYS
jgi:hypothetical protein